MPEDKALQVPEDKRMTNQRTSALVRRGLTDLQLATEPALKQGQHGRQVTFLAVDPNGEWAVTGARAADFRGNTLKVWSLPQGRELRVLQIAEDYGYPSVAISPDGHKIGLIVSRRHTQNTLVVLDSETGQEIERRQFPELESCMVGPYCAIDAGNHLELLDWATGKVRHSLTKSVFAPRESIGPWIIDPTGRFLVAGCSIFAGYTDEDGDGANFRYRLQVWDLATGSGLHTGRQNGFSHGLIGFTPTGTQLVIDNGSGLEWYELPTGQIRRQLKWRPELGSHAARIIGNRVVAFGHQGDIDMIDIASGQAVSSWKGPSHIWHCQFVPRYNLIVAGCSDGAVHFIDFADR
jgi:WD40 repeat protein